MPVTSRFDATSTALDVVDGLDLSGRRALVTGGAGGMGREIARALSAAGASVVIADVDEVPLREAADALGLPAMRLDLASFAAIRGFAAAWRAEQGSLTCSSPMPA